MWHIITKEQEEATRRQIEEQAKRMYAEAAEKRKRRERWIKNSTCDKCGRHDPIPPWLQ